MRVRGIRSTIVLITDISKKFYISSIKIQQTLRDKFIFKHLLIIVREVKLQIKDSRSLYLVKSRSKDKRGEL